MPKTTASSFYPNQDTFLIAVDCIIFGFKDNKISLLVQPRFLEPFKNGLSLLGGFVKENESVEQAASSVLSRLTGLENIYMEQVGVYGALERDPGDRVVSCAFYALIDIESQDEKLLDEHKAFWININRANELIFDHPQMVVDAIQILRRKAATQPIGFNLLPEKFTLSQLQILYEAIYNQTFDIRNFRKKMLGMDFLEKLNEVDKSGSKKGAFFYRFKEEKTHVAQESSVF
ncbi:MAG: NUDIX domain-containing protein [Paludibacter sp.]